MDFITGSSKNSWQPVMTWDTTTTDYWINWRVLLCSIWVLISLVFSLCLIFKYEGPRNSGPERKDSQERRAGLLYEDEVWKPCLKQIHPAWLLLFRVVALLVLFGLLILNPIVDGGAIFYFYTQWTFTLVTIYFGLGSFLSVYGCYKYHNRVGGAGHDDESWLEKCSGRPSQCSDRKIAGFWAYLFQVIFQINAGAVMLTDCVFWFIIVPFLTMKDYNLNFLVVIMHSINAFFLMGDMALNSLRCPWFRIGYFFLWTSTYVIVQWIVHVCIRLWWPYPFLELKSPWSPLWYLSVGLMHIPCYGLFALLMKLKHFLFTRWFPQTYCYMR